MTDNESTAGGPLPAVPVQEATWRERADKPLYHVTLWPNRSLSRRGLGWLMGLAGAGLAIPLGAAAATPVFWVLLPFCAVTLGCLWLAFRRNYADGRLTEEVSLWRGELRVERREPKGRILRWSADPLRVRLRLYEEGKVEQYLTLSAGGREIELGAFLSPEERVSLAAEIEAALDRAVRTA